jgi:hypothetical protein
MAKKAKAKLALVNDGWRRFPIDFFRCCDKLAYNTHATSAWNSTRSDESNEVLRNWWRHGRYCGGGEFTGADRRPPLVLEDHPCAFPTLDLRLAHLPLI